MGSLFSSQDEEDYDDVDGQGDYNHDDDYDDQEEDHFYDDYEDHFDHYPSAIEEERFYDDYMDQFVHYRSAIEEQRFNNDEMYEGSVDVEPHLLNRSGIGLSRPGQGHSPGLVHFAPSRGFASGGQAQNFTHRDQARASHKRCVSCGRCCKKQQSLCRHCQESKFSGQAQNLTHRDQACAFRKCCESCGECCKQTSALCRHCQRSASSGQAQNPRYHNQARASHDSCVYCGQCCKKKQRVCRHCQISPVRPRAYGHIDVLHHSRVAHDSRYDDYDDPVGHYHDWPSDEDEAEYDRCLDMEVEWWCRRGNELSRLGQGLHLGRVQSENFARRNGPLHRRASQSRSFLQNRTEL